MSIDTDGLKECVDCGRCCFSNDPKYLLVAGYDYERLGAVAERVTQRLDGLAYMRLSEDGHCAQLAFDARKGQFLCGLYEKRPDVCRALERGSGQCRQDYSEKKERPLVLLRRAGQEKAPLSS